VTISLRSAGTASGFTAAVTAVTPTVGAGVVATDISFLFVTAKPYTTTITTPTGWTKVGEWTNGTDTSAAGTGSVKVALYFRPDAIAAGAIPAIEQGAATDVYADVYADAYASGTGANTMLAQIVTYATTLGAWDVTLFSVGGQGSTATDYAATAASGIAVATGDRVLGITGLNSATGARSAASFTSLIGATQTDHQGRANATCTTGDDSCIYWRDVLISAGSSNTAPTLSFTNTAASAGETVFLRLREVSGVADLTGGSNVATITATPTATGKLGRFSAASPLNVTSTPSATGVRGVTSGSSALGVTATTSTYGVTSGTSPLNVTATPTATGSRGATGSSVATAVTAVVTAQAGNNSKLNVTATPTATGTRGTSATAAIAASAVIQAAAAAAYVGSAPDVTAAVAVNSTGSVSGAVSSVSAILSGFEVFGPSVVGATAVVSGFEAFGAGASSGATAVLSGFEAAGTNTALVAVLSGPAAVEPGDVLTLSLASSSGSPTGYAVVQLAGPIAGLVGTGGTGYTDAYTDAYSDSYATSTDAVTWVGVAPFVLPDPVDSPILMTFQGTVTSGAGSSSATWTVVLYPHTMWKVLGGVLVPMKIYAAVPPTPSGASICLVQAAMSATGALGTAPPNVSRSSAPSALIAVSALGTVGGGTALFTHPGVIMTGSMMSYVQANITVAPYAAAWLKVTNKTNDISGSTNINLRFSDPTWTAHPIAQVGRGSGGSPSEGDTDMYSDAMAASVQAMMWAFQGNRVAANNATRIINAWATTCTLIKYDDVVYSDGKLLAGWIGSLFARAAEIIRWTYTPTGSDPVLNVNAVKTFFTNVVYPRVLFGHNGGGANWLLSMADATIQMAVFNDDQAAFATGVTNWRSWTKSSIWRTGDVNGHTYGGGGSGGLPIAPRLSMYDSDSYSGSGYASPRLGFIGYWRDPAPTTGFWVNGLQGEIGRDPWHASMGWGAMCNAAETAWHQGIALWTEEESRITTSMELLAGWLSSVFVTGQNPPSGQGWPFSVPMGNRGASDSQRATWEISYNHYHNRRGINLPKTLSMLTNYQRPGSYNVNLHMIGENTTHRDNTA
jgi:hypothetical protein